jgi:hypothetical protein
MSGMENLATLLESINELVSKLREKIEYESVKREALEVNLRNQIEILTRSMNGNESQSNVYPDWENS